MTELKAGRRVRVELEGTLEYLNVGGSSWDVRLDDGEVLVEYVPVDRMTVIEPPLRKGVVIPGGSQISEPPLGTVLRYNDGSIVTHERGDEGTGWYFAGVRGVFAWSHVVSSRDREVLYVGATD